MSKKKRTSRAPRVRYRSKFEAKVSEALETKLKEPFEYEVSRVPYRLDLEYKPDWTVGGKYHIEAKGKFDYIERRKILAVLRTNPGIDVRMVFMRNQKISKNSETRYGDWCDKYGIRWTVFPDLPIT